MSDATLLERVAHRVMHPMGQTLRAVSPLAYERLRWRIAKSPLLHGLMGNPMYQQFALPFVVRKGDTVFDIGANTGQFTLPLARLVRASGAVHAFEPISQTFGELDAAVKRAGVAPRVVLNRVGFGESSGEVSFTLPVDRPTEATAAPHHAESWGDYETDPGQYVTETCEVTTVDEYVAAGGIEHVAFMKCDVEGGELGVLRGARGLLKSARPPVIMLELFDGWTKSFGYEPRDALNFLEREAGYECYWICEQGLQRVKPDDPVIPGVFWEWVDYLFVIPDIHRSRIDVERYST